MADVFVSYKAEDRRRVESLVQALQADGLTVWWDEHISAGDEWSQTIERQLESARSVVVMWSKRSVGPEGRFVREEARRAQRRDCYVPILIDAVEPPLGFAENQAISLRGWRGSRSDPRYQTVLAAIRRHAALGDATAAPAQPRAMNRRAVVVGGAIVTLAAVGVGAWELFKPAEASAAGSIAVLPFANLSGDPNQAYFSDGIAEEIRSALTRLPGLKVIGRSSSEAVRNEDATSAAEKLGVADILTGSVRRSPSTIRITAELIDGRTGVNKWSQNYDRSPGDTIKIQTEIAASVANVLRIALGTAERAALTVGGTQNSQAQDLLLQAANLDQFSRKAREHALQLVDHAIELDPNYADAYARKSQILGWMAQFFSRSSSERVVNLAKAERSAKRALELAPRLPHAHTAMAAVHISYLRQAAAGQEYQQALALAPNDIDTLRGYAVFVAWLGRTAESLRIAERAVALDPFSRETHGSRAFALYLGRRYADALTEQRLIIRNWPDEKAQPLLASMLVLLGRNQEAEQWLKRIDPESPWRLTLEAMIRARTRDRAGAIGVKNRLKQLYGDNLNYEYAKIDAQLGDTDQALADLERAWELKEGEISLIRVEPWLDPLRNDPRFVALVNKMDFPA
jgi:serine/threonine-protein kinase